MKLPLTMGLMLAICCAAGCAGPITPAAPADPFVTEYRMEEGLSFRLEGNSRNHRTDRPSQFSLTLVNETADAWAGRYCLQLYDEQGVVQDIGRREFSLEPGGEASREIEVWFDPDLKPGAYGLAVVFPGRGSTVTTVWLGAADQPGGPWPTVKDCGWGLTGIARESVIELRMRDGATGNLGTTDHAVAIAEFVRWFETLELTQIRCEQTVGFLYYIDLETADGETVRLTFKGDRVQVGDACYAAATPVKDFLDRFHLSLEARV